MLSERLEWNTHLENCCARMFPIMVNVQVRTSKQESKRLLDLHKVRREERYVSQAEEKVYNIKWKVGLKKENTSSTNAGDDDG